MPSSFLSRSPLMVLIPVKYSIGLVNMLAVLLMNLIFTKIFQQPEILLCSKLTNQGNLTAARRTFFVKLLFLSA